MSFNKGNIPGRREKIKGCSSSLSLRSDLDYRSELGSSGESINTMHLETPQLYFIDQESLGCSGDLMKYKTSYTNLLKSFRALEKEHNNHLQSIKSKHLPLPNGRKPIEDFLDDFAIRVANKKEKFDKEQTIEAINEGNSIFIAKRWKRRYCKLLDAIDFLYRDYRMIHMIMDTEQDNILNMKLSSSMECRLNEIENDYSIHESIYEESDLGITISTAFISDLVSQCRIYRGELDKQFAIKERLFYVLKKAKEQRAKLKIFVNALRDELRDVMIKMKETQAALALQYTETKQHTTNKSNDEQVEYSQPDAADILNLQGKIQELERILKEEETRRKKLHNKLQEIIGNIRVYCRIRPHPNCIMKVSSDDKLLLSSESLPERVTKTWGTPMKCFIFDKVFDPMTCQGNIFNSVSELITSCVDGFNVCIMAYGQTGSGKTHTMMGTPNDPGINRRAIKELLRVCNERKQWSYQLFLSMVEIYNEEIRDLLNQQGAANDKSTNLNIVKIMSPQDDEIVLQGLSEHEVKSEEDIISYLELGEKNRKVGSTLMNIQSSRSHFVLLLKVNGENNVHKTSSRGALTLCDLAGSENISKSGATGQRFTEATSINKSLTSLGRVFDSLRRRQKPSYRESKLTFLLKPTLGGDSKCLLLVNVRSEPDNVEESMRALFFGQNAMQIAPEQTQQKSSNYKNLKK